MLQLQQTSKNEKQYVYISKENPQFLLPSRLKYGNIVNGKWANISFKFIQWIL